MMGGTHGRPDRAGRGDGGRLPERVMCDGLARITLADLTLTVRRKALNGFETEVEAWLSARVSRRRNPMQHSDLGEPSHPRPKPRTSRASKGAR